jgi:hypothetical protein
VRFYEQIRSSSWFLQRPVEYRNVTEHVSLRKGADGRLRALSQIAGKLEFCLRRLTDRSAMHSLISPPIDAIRGSAAVVTSIVVTSIWWAAGPNENRGRSIRGVQHEIICPPLVPVPDLTQRARRRPDPESRLTSLFALGYERLRRAERRLTCKVTSDRKTTKLGLSRCASFRWWRVSISAA